MRQKTNDIERMFRRHYARMHRVAMALLGDPDESRDAVSDVFARLLDDGGEASLVPTIEAEEAYLVRSVRNRCLNLIARKGVRERVERLLIPDDDGCDDGLIDNVRAAIGRLAPPVRQQVLRLRFHGGMAYDDIASTLGISKATVYRHLAAALRFIREDIKNNL